MNFDKIKLSFKQMSHQDFAITKMFVWFSYFSTVYMGVFCVAYVSVLGFLNTYTIALGHTERESYSDSCNQNVSINCLLK